MSKRPYDLILWGATGFTGALVAEYLVKNPARVGGLKWALAGRSREKLEKVRGELAEISPDALSLPLVIADAADPASLEAMVSSTRVVATTVGPFRTHGPPLVAACARLGTHYCDLTGEPHFVRDMIDAHHEEAKASGARIVHCCGFDSIPSDLGVLMLQTHAREVFGAPLSRIQMMVESLKGGISGGTIASMMLLAEEAARDPKVRRQLANPYVLDPERTERGPDKGDQRSLKWNAEANRWTAPFVMEAINARVVRRTNALLGYAWGRDFRYGESSGMPPGVKGAVMGAGMTAGLGGFFAAALTSPGRALLRRVLPKPGEGPPRAAREGGRFTLRFYGEGEAKGGTPVKLRGVVKGTSDPGYGETAKMLAESALCLATGGDALSKEGGVLTPAVAMGAPLLARLREAGMTFSVS